MAESTHSSSTPPAVPVVDEISLHVLTPAPSRDPTLINNLDEKESEEKEPPPVVAPYTIYSSREIWSIMMLVGFAGLFSPLTANIYFPVIPEIASDLKVSVESINLTITFYMFMQGISPTFWGAICDVLGRRPAYLATFTVYIGASLGLAQTRVYWVLLLLRMVQAAGSASVIAIGAGTLADLAQPHNRGGYMSIFSVGATIAPCIAPIAGGLLAQRWRWQSLFWFTAVFGIAVFVVMFIFLPETLRSIVGNGSIPPAGINRSPWSIIRARRHRNDPIDISAIPSMPVKKTWRDVKPFGPIKMFREKDVLLLLTVNTVIYCVWYCVITSAALAFQRVYHLSVDQLGLCFLANGAGCLVSAMITGPRLDFDYKIVAARVEAAKKARIERGEVIEEAPPTDSKAPWDLTLFPIEQARLRSFPPFAIVFLSSTIIYGWTLEKAVHISVPLICQFFIGLCATTFLILFGTLLVDLFPGQSASASAAGNLYRCLCGAAATAIIEPLLNAMGAGWAFTMLSLITVLFLPLIWVEWVYGMHLRKERKARLMRVREKEEAKKREEEARQVAEKV